MDSFHPHSSKPLALSNCIHGLNCIHLCPPPGTLYSSSQARMELGGGWGVLTAVCNGGRGLNLGSRAVSLNRGQCPLGF